MVLARSRESNFVARGRDFPVCQRIIVVKILSPRSVLIHKALILQHLKIIWIVFCYEYNIHIQLYYNTVVFNLNYFLQYHFWLHYIYFIDHENEFCIPENEFVFWIDSSCRTWYPPQKIFSTKICSSTQNTEYLWFLVTRITSIEYWCRADRSTADHKCGIGISILIVDSIN